MGGDPVTKRSRKKRSAWGALTQVDESTWRLRYWSSGPDGYKRRSRTIRGSRLDAERVRSELMLAHSEDAPCPTVGEVWERYALPAYERREKDGDMSAYTLRQYRSGWSRHASPRWADVPCDAVRPLEVQQWLDGLSYNGALQAMNVLRPTVDYAVRYGVVDANPFRERYLMPSKSGKATMDRGVWTLDELGEVWRAVHGEWLEAAFLLAAFGGCRVGEALGVRSEDVTITDVGGVPVALVAIERQVPSMGAEVRTTLKNRQSRRTIAVPGRAGLRLAELARERDGWLTGDGLGGPTTQRRLMLAWKSAAMAHPFRNLRNSYETNARWSLRLPPWVVEPLLGHGGQGVTAMYYDRPSAEMFAEMVADAYRARPYDAAWEWAD